MAVLKNSVKLLLAAGLLLAGTAVAAQDNAGSGQELYQKLCASCHSASPAAMKGKPVDALLAGIKKAHAGGQRAWAPAFLRQFFRRNAGLRCIRFKGWWALPISARNRAPLAMKNSTALSANRKAKAPDSA